MWNYVNAFYLQYTHKGGNDDFHNSSLSFSVHEKEKRESKEDRHYQDVGNKKLHVRGFWIINLISFSYICKRVTAFYPEW